METAAPTRRPRHVSGPPGARLVGSGHDDQCGESRLRPTGVRRARRTVCRGVERLRGNLERRSRTTRRGARAHLALHRRERRQRRPDRAPESRGRQTVHCGARVRPHAGGGGRHSRGSLAADFDKLEKGYQKGWESYDKSLVSRRTSCRAVEATCRRAERRLLPERERHQGVGGQDVPGRDLGEPRLALGAGRLGRRSREHVLRLLSRDLCARSVRGLDRARSRRRPRDGARRRPLPLRAAATSGRLAAAQQPRQRQTGPGFVRDADGRGCVPDPDGRPARADRCGPVHRSHPPRRELVVSHGPSFGAERWEEQGGYSPSTIAAEIAGLVAAAHIAE